MKIFYAMTAFILLQFQVLAQVPEKFSFQGVAKNSLGQPLVTGSDIVVRFTIHSGNANGVVVYKESHTATVDAGAIFNLMIGGGTIIQGDFKAIDWNVNQYYFQVEIDTGAGFTDIGTSQLLSVPYAMYSKRAESWQNDFPVVQTGTVGSGKSISSIGAGARMIWYPHKAAFRAGENLDDVWEDFNIGQFSFGGGKRTLAQGQYSTALGNASKAEGASSVAIGRLTNAIGEASVALGEGTVSRYFGGMAVGAYNDSQDGGAGGTKAASDPQNRIFQIGNGSGFQSTSNALTVLRNGNIGIGKEVLSPTHILEVGGRSRIRHSNATAGIFFDNSSDTPVGFVGMQNDNNVGFYIGNKWILNASSSAVYANGNVIVSGVVIQNSDIRLKRNLNNLNQSLARLRLLRGYQYQWKDPSKDQSLQTGLIAQEVEELFPELVKTDERGMKSVNYIGLVPHLIEAIKELKKENQERVDQLEAKINMLLNAAARQETTPSK